MCSFHGNDDEEEGWGKRSGQARPLFAQREVQSDDEEYLLGDRKWEEPTTQQVRPHPPHAVAECVSSSCLRSKLFLIWS